MASTTRNENCTHISMTRIYNPDFRCALCLNPGTMGWLYRCTEDTELILEDDLENNKGRFGDLSYILPESAMPKEESPEVHMSTDLGLSCEAAQEDLQGYSADQVKIIISQRARVLGAIEENGFEEIFASGPELGQDPAPLSLDSLPAPTHKTKKPTVPTQECQFKCCHSCRPSSSQRSFLNLDAIANGEFPATAITGFGFHYLKDRPVALTKHVRNLDVGQTHPTRSTHKTLEVFPWPPIARSTTPCKKSTAFVPAVPGGPFNGEVNPDTFIGQLCNAYGFTIMTSSLSIEIYSGIVDAIAHGQAAENTSEVTTVAKPTIIKESKANSNTNTITTWSSNNPGWTPPNSPTLQPTIIGDLDQRDSRRGPYGTGERPLRTSGTLRSRFTQDNGYRGGYGNRVCNLLEKSIDGGPADVLVTSSSEEKTLKAELEEGEN